MMATKTMMKNGSENANDGKLVLNPFGHDKKPANDTRKPVKDTFTYAGIEIATENQALVEMMAQAVTKKVDSASRNNQSQVKGWQNEVTELETWNAKTEAQIAQLRDQIKANNARLSEVRKELAAYDATSSAIENQVLRQLVQLGIVTSEQLPVKATKQRTYSRGTGIKKASFSIEFDGEVDGEQSYFDTPGNLAWYKFGKCGAPKLFDVLAEQNNGIRAGSPEHEQLPNKRLAAQLDGHTFAFIMK